MSTNIIPLITEGNVTSLVPHEVFFLDTISLRILVSMTLELTMIFLYADDSGKATICYKKKMNHIC